MGKIGYNAPMSDPNAVPDEAIIYIDRRMTFGESKEQVIEQVRALVPAELRDSVTVEELFYDEPSYTGFVFPVHKYFPAWAYEENHPLVQAGQTARRLIGLPDGPSGKWNFSTNGIYWAGKAGIPSIGFGPGDEETAHTTRDSVSLDDVVITSFTTGPGNTTLPLLIWSKVKLGVTPDINALATLTVLVVGAGVVVAGIILKVEGGAFGAKFAPGLQGLGVEAEAAMPGGNTHSIKAAQQSEM